MSESGENEAGEEFEHVWIPGESPWTLLLLHGTGGDENDLVPLARQLAPDCGVLSPRGKILENGMHRRFFRRLDIGRLDIPDLLAQTDDLAAFVSKSAGEYGFDPSHVLALGFSNGANIAVSLLFRHPDLLAGAALLRPMLPYEPEPGLALHGRKVFIAAGGQDPYVPPHQLGQLEGSLAKAGAQVRLRLDEGAGHGLTQDDLAALTAWLQGVIGI